MRLKKYTWMDFFIIFSLTLSLSLSLFLSFLRCKWTQFRRIKRGELLNSSAGKRRLQSRLKQGIAARLLSPPVPSPSTPGRFLSLPRAHSRSRLAHKRKKIVKRAERLLPSFIFLRRGTAMQLANYPAIRTPLDTLPFSPRPSFLRCSRRRSSLPSPPPFYTDMRAYTRVCVQDRSSFRAPIHFRFFVI